MTIPKKGGYTGGRPASEMRPPAQVPSETIKPACCGPAGRAEGRRVGAPAVIDSQGAPEQRRQITGKAYYAEHGWSGCDGSAWDGLSQATRDGWNAAAREATRLLNAPRVEITKSMLAPAECRVWVGGVLRFDGVSRAAFAIPINPADPGAKP